MALMKCPECGGTVSDKAEICPHCGCPVEEKKVTCACCGSEDVVVIERGWTMSIGILGTRGKVNLCRNCGHRWKEKPPKK